MSLTDRRQRTILDHLALIDNDDRIAGHLHFRQNVGREQHGVLLAELAHQFSRLADLGRVEPGRWFVEDQHGRVGKQRIGQPDALAIAFRQRADELAADVLSQQRSRT